MKGDAEAEGAREQMVEVHGDQGEVEVARLAATAIHRRSQHSQLSKIETWC